MKFKVHNPTVHRDNSYCDKFSRMLFIILNNRSYDFWQIFVKCACIMVNSVAIDTSFRNLSLKACCTCVYYEWIICRACLKTSFDLFLQKKEIRVQNTDKCLSLSTRTLGVLPCNNGLNQKWTWTRKIHKDDNAVVK